MSYTRTYSTIEINGQVNLLLTKLTFFAYHSEYCSYFKTERMQFY